MIRALKFLDVRAVEMEVMTLHHPFDNKKIADEPVDRKSVV